MANNVNLDINDSINVSKIKINVDKLRSHIAGKSLMMWDTYNDYIKALFSILSQSQYNVLKAYKVIFNKDKKDTLLYSIDNIFMRDEYEEYYGFHVDYINKGPKFFHSYFYMFTQKYEYNLDQYSNIFLIPKSIIYEGHISTYTSGTVSIYEFNDCILNKVSMEKYKTMLLNRYVKNPDVTILNQQDKKQNVISIGDTSTPVLLLTKETFDKSTADTGIYFTNRNMAKIFKQNHLSIEHYIDIFKVDEKELVKKLKQLSRKNLHICMIGFGGTMSNFVYNLSELCNKYNINNIFETLFIFENDDLEVSNFPRITTDFLTPVFVDTKTNNSNKTKALMIFNHKNIAKNIHVDKAKFTNKMDYRYPEAFLKGFDYFIGSPDLKTREMIYKENYKFICPLHNMDYLYIYTTPNMVNSELLIESYGTINLSWFFFNMFKMTLEVIDLMLSDKFNNDELVLSYSAKEHIEEFNDNLKKSNNMYIVY